MLLHVHVCRYSPQCRVVKKGAWLPQDTLMEVVGQGKLLITPIGSLTTSIREYQVSREEEAEHPWPLRLV